jgi:5'-nucleotidase / UDP-sugar diphosphatase
MIIGGHSHTILEKPALVNNILIAQAGVGTDHVGRFDIVVDDDTNSIVAYRWQLIPIEDGIAEPDDGVARYIESFKTIVDQKYNTVICKFTEQLTHPMREIETSLGNLFADAIAEMGECNIMLVGSGSIRVKELGPVVTLKTFHEAFPYDDFLKRFNITGAQLKKIFGHIMRMENRNGEGECYQVNGRIKAVYNEGSKKLESITFDGKQVNDDDRLSIGLIGYHILNSEAFLSLTNEELTHAGGDKVIATNAADVLEEYLKSHQNVGRKVEGRLQYI